MDPVFIKDDHVMNPYFAPITEMPRKEALTLLKRSKQDGNLPVNLQEICDYELLPLRFLDIQEKNTGARLVQTKGEWFIEVDNEGSADRNFSADKIVRRRQRFSVAHELGHYAMKSHCEHELQGALLSGHNPHASSYARQRESQANEFATELLLPYTELKPVLKGIDFKDDLFTSVEQLADRFDASMTATLKRVASILDIPVVAIHFAPDGKSHQVPSYSVDYKQAGFYFPRDGAIPTGSYAATLFEGKTPATRGRKSYRDCRVWFPERRRDDYRTVEWALNLGPRFGILVFLELIENESY